MKAIYTHFLLLSFAILLVLFPASLEAQCVTPYQGGRVTGNVSFGNPINWANPNRSTVSDDLRSRVRLQPGETSKYLLMRDVFSATPLPAGATILGVELYVERRADLGGQFHDASVKLYVNGAPAGNDYGMTALPWPDKDAPISYGGVGDNWGLALTPADVNSAQFGAVISTTRLGGPSGVLQAEIDYMAIRVFYIAPGSPCTLDATTIELVGTKEGSNLQLEWLAPGGSAAEHFDLQKSYDGVEFNTLSSLPVDQAQKSGDIYGTEIAYPNEEVMFRIRQVDADGYETFSQVLRLEMEGDDAKLAHIGPNPFQDWLGLNFSDEFEGDANLMTMDGKVVRSVEIKRDAIGQERIEGLDDLAPGVYFLRLQGPEGVQTEKLVRM